MTAPDFIIIGAMKCGTSTLQAQLAAQSNIFMTTPKEPNFFSDDEIYARGRDWYSALFAPAPTEALKGEASTHYAKLPTYAQTVDRLFSAAPQIKLIYMMRHPIDRLISHFIHDWTQGERVGAIDDAARAGTVYVDYGRYSYQLAPFIERFGAQRILPVFLERFNAAPEGELDRIGRFLGLDGQLQWRADVGAQNVSAERIRRFPLYRTLIESAPATALRRALVPRALRDFIKTRFQMQNRPHLSAPAHARAEQIFNEDLAALGRHFGVALNCENFRQTVLARQLDFAARN